MGAWKIMSRTNLGSTIITCFEAKRRTENSKAVIIIVVVTKNNYD